MENKYTDIEEHPESLGDPIATYGCEVGEQDVATAVKYLPADIVNGAAAYALWEEQNGKLIPNNRVLDYVYKDLGWK